MKTLSLLLVFLICLHIQGFSQTWQWTHPEPNGVELTSYPDPYAYDDDNVHDVEVDASGNIYVLGNFLDSLYLNNNFITRGNGSYLAKYDSTGNLLWKKLIVPTTPIIDAFGSSKILATDLTVNASGVYITGRYYPTVYGLDCSTSQVTIGVQRSYAIGNVNFTSPVRDLGLFITKFNGNGGVVWNKIASHTDSCYDGIGGDDTYADIESNPIITSDNKNNVIAGFMLRTDLHYISIDGSVIQLPGTVNNHDIGAYQLVVSKFSSAGIMQWGTYAGGGGGLNAVLDCNSLISDKNNNIFFLGTASDSTFFGSQIFRENAPSNNGNATFIAKISSAGVWQFAKELSNTSDTYMKDGNEFGSNGTGNPEKLTIDNSNFIYALVDASTETQVILGDTVSHGTINTSCYLVKMNPSSNLTWVKSFGNKPYNTYTNSIHFNNNNLYICGSNPSPNPYYLGEQKLVFSSLYVPNVQGSLNNEFYAAKADLNGNFIWVTTFQDGGYSAYGASITAFNGNLYIGGNYQSKITSLGNLSGSFTNPNVYIPNIFFGKLKDQYIKVGAVTPTNIIPGCSITIPFTSTGLAFSAGNTFTAELSDINGYFNNPTAIGSVVSTGTGTITATIPASLTYGGGYRVRIYSSDTLKTGLGYYAYADTPYVLSLICPPPSAGFAATNITANSATVNWTAVGCASGYKVQYRVKGTTAWTTVNIITNTSTLNIAGLAANTIYQWRVATRCRNNGIYSFSAFSRIQEFTTAASFASAIDAEDLQASTPNFSVYPNPAKGTATIDFNAVKAGRSTIEISDMAGRMVYHFVITTSAGKNKHSIDISRFAQGMYLVTLTQPDNSRQTVKLNKE